MTIRFAAPRYSLAARMHPREISRACRRPANDNADEPPFEAMLQAALRHFANHGLAAARRARLHAEAAAAAGDTQSYQWWLAICRTLDRRMACQIGAGRTGELG